MKKYILLVLVHSLLISCSSEQKSANKEIVDSREELPNIVLLVGDDQGYPYFGFMGADYVKTPYMDALASSGTLFTQGYVPQNHCRPSLQTLMTGTLPVQYWNEAGQMKEEKKATPAYDTLDEEAKKEWERNFDFHAMQYFETLPRILAEYGYTSFQGGKWWEFNYQNGGFSEGMTKGWSEEDEGQNDWFLKFMGGEGTELARATMQPVYDFIDNNKEKPFFIWYAPELPHYPFDAPDKYYNIYSGEEMTESAKRYYANCTWFDDGVGELFKYLKEKNEFENTLFIYVNDNGWEQAPDQEFRHDSLRWHNGGDKGKLSMFDQSFRTPIIFSWVDKVPEGIVNEALMHSADIPATILDYIGKPVPDNYFGTSYVKVIQEGAIGPRREIFGNVNQIRWEGDMMGRSIEGYWYRDENWFFNWDVTNNSQMLFNMKEDPNNDNNLAPDNPEWVAEVVEKINSWKSEINN
jgi:uncharacterized sulfatase